MQVVLDQSVSVIGGSPSNPAVFASAHAVVAGTSGNIAVGFFWNDTDHGGWGFLNTTAFTGGQDAQIYTFVQQSDITNAETPLISAQEQTAQNAVQAQIQSGEQLDGSINCTSSASSDHAVGDKVTTFTVTVSVTCSGEVYASPAAQTMAVSLLKQQVGSYALVGTPAAQITQVGSPQSGTIALTVQASGTGVFQFSSAQLQQFAQSIAGKSEQDAQTWLMQQAGVAQVTIAIPGGYTVLPADEQQITIAVSNT